MHSKPSSVEAVCDCHTGANCSIRVCIYFLYLYVTYTYVAVATKDSCAMLTASRFFSAALALVPAFPRPHLAFALAIEGFRAPTAALESAALSLFPAPPAANHRSPPRPAVLRREIFNPNPLSLQGDRADHFLCTLEKSLRGVGIHTRLDEGFYV